ncbi:hypothetical protein [Aquimarina sp. 2201CG14-23]|uniref:hypothetical protein n=1 Tax=Aquimarina mycalae TaxID=3040073 RepID=UPI002477EF9B|nr:hypothetical protein [Aquimarina sp. 2201CG14-23]MDH7446967.1 hypothetical protein [Aquimarina sp. 2201CG14-23]
MGEEMYMRIEKYLSGSMSTEEVIQFQEEMNVNPSLDEEVGLYRAINLHLSNTVDEDTLYSTKYKSELEKYIKSNEGKKIKENLLNARTEQQYNLKPGKSNKRFLYFLVSTAAAIVFVFIFLFMKKSEQELYAEYYKVEELPSFASRSAQPTLLSTARTNFRKANFEESLLNFNEYITANTEDLDPLVYIYTGLIYAEKNNLKKALEQLTLLEKSDTLDSSRSLWYKALIFLKFEKKIQAENMLHLILKDSNNFKYNEAKELLEKI